jgi:carboxyl-terminal processing protease
MKKRRRLAIFGWLVIVSLVIGGFLISEMPMKSAVADSQEYQNLRLFTEALTIIKNSYVEKVNTQDLIYGALKGMLGTLDPHSGFMPPEEYKEMQIDTRGEFGGLGIQIGVKKGMLTVIAPIEDTPAWKAGIKAGDKIIKVEGESTRDMTLFEAVKKMRGPSGTKVTITIVREGWKEPKDFTITRNVIKIKSVKYKVVDDGIGYIKINQFQERTASDLANALKNLSDKKIDSLVLDLRNNPGGLLKSAVDVTEQFLPPDKLVVYIKGRSVKKTEYMTTGNHPHYDLPMIVMVNHGSASASEIVAGALKDWKRAVLLGVRTFGKGSVQSVIPLSGGSGLRLTTAKYYTPKGISIQNEGIEPDIVVKVKPQNGEAYPVIREKDLEHHLKNEQRPEEKETKKTVKETEVAPLQVDEKNDVQLQQAIDLLKGWRVFRESSIDNK